MNYINRRYYESQQENPDGIWHYLSCVQKIAYFQFLDNNIDMEDIFCDDINIRVVELKDELLISRNCLKSLNDYFNVVKASNPENPIQYLREKIDQGTIVGLNTYFYDIPNFLWYHGEGNQDSKHICMVVGYDKKSIWLTDVPGNMISEYLTDNHITKISNVEMQGYLNKRCNLIMFPETMNIKHKYDDLRSLIEDMVKENSVHPHREEEGIVWKGKWAYERLIELLRIKDPRVLKLELYHGDYMATIISGRRELLRRNIIKKYGNSEGVEMVSTQLNASSEMWKIFGNKILKDVLKSGVHNPKEEDIINIYKSEIALVESLAEFVEIIKNK